MRAGAVGNAFAFDELVPAHSGGHHKVRFFFIFFLLIVVSGVLVPVSVGFRLLILVKISILTLPLPLFCPNTPSLLPGRDQIGRADVVKFVTFAN